VALRTAQAAMRHSDPRLTANVYTDPRLLDVHGAVEARPTLPTVMTSTEPSESTSVSATFRATGTDDAAATEPTKDVVSIPYRILTGNPDIRCDSVTSDDTEAKEVTANCHSEKTLENKAFERDCERLTSHDTKAGELGFEARYFKCQPHGSLVAMPWLPKSSAQLPHQCHVSNVSRKCALLSRICPEFPGFDVRGRLSSAAVLGHLDVS
jgi:hypothetical protein